MVLLEYLDPRSCRIILVSRLQIWQNLILIFGGLEEAILSIYSHVLYHKKLSTKNRIFAENYIHKINFNPTTLIVLVVSFRFWYISLVSCHRNVSSLMNTGCSWAYNSQQDVLLHYDVWFVNGNPFTKHVNPFEHQFSFELHDVFELYLVFLIVYSFLVPIQLYALARQKHLLPLLLTCCMSMEYVGVIFNFIHVFKFAFDGQGVDLLHVVGNFIDQVSSIGACYSALSNKRPGTLINFLHFGHGVRCLFSGVW